MGYNNESQFWPQLTNKTHSSWGCPRRNILQTQRPLIQETLKPISSKYLTDLREFRLQMFRSTGGECIHRTRIIRRIDSLKLLPVLSRLLFLDKWLLQAEIIFIWKILNLPLAVNLISKMLKILFFSNLVQGSLLAALKVLITYLARKLIDPYGSLPAQDILWFYIKQEWFGSLASKWLGGDLAFKFSKMVFKLCICFADISHVGYQAVLVKPLSLLRKLSLSRGQL